MLVALYSRVVNFLEIYGNISNTVEAMTSIICNQICRTKTSYFVVNIMHKVKA